jgi:hypothetical protein
MKLTSMLSVFALALVLTFAGTAQAATGVMPVLYNSSGVAVNTSGGVLQAGTYYLGTGATQPVTYFGDGSFYNAATNMYGGSVYNPTGAAGIYNIPAQGEAPDPGPVGIPNTGAGGDAMGVWALLALSGSAAVAGAFYLARSRNVHA